MPFTGSLEDRIAIRELFDSYSSGANMMDRDAFLAAWTADAEWQTHYFDLKGIDAIASQYDAIMGPVTVGSFISQIFSIEVDGDTATVGSIAQERLAMPGGTFRLTGRYADKLARTADGWRFARREYHVMFEEAPGVNECPA